MGDADWTRIIVQAIFGLVTVLIVIYMIGKDKREDKVAKAAREYARLIRSISDRLWGHLSAKSGESLIDLMRSVSTRKQHKTVDQESPITLTQKGLEVAEKIQAMSTADKYRNKTCASDDADKSTIQDICSGFSWCDLLRIDNIEETEAIRKSIYQEISEPEDVYFVFGVLLRDEILELRSMEAPSYLHSVSP